MERMASESISKQKEKQAQHQRLLQEQAGLRRSVEENFERSRPSHKLREAEAAADAEPSWRFSSDKSRKETMLERQRYKDELDALYAASKAGHPADTASQRSSVLPTQREQQLRKSASASLPTFMRLTQPIHKAAPPPLEEARTEVLEQAFQRQKQETLKRRCAACSSPMLHALTIE